MLKFDKLKVVADIGAIRIDNMNQFNVIKKGDKVVSLKYHQDLPSLLVVKVDYENKEVVVEFTGKILEKDYPELISINTIRKCFSNINALGFCTLDIDAMMNSQVVKADVTKDVKGINTSEVVNYFQSHICNYSRYKYRVLKNGNMIIETSAIGKKTKKRMTVYNKEKEMNMAKNKRFAVENGIEHAFDNACRFELNLNSKALVRTSLGVEDNKLINVLQSSANPIRDYVEEVICKPSDNIDYSDANEYKIMLVLKDCNYDLENVEAKMRSIYKRGFRMSRIMEPYRVMLERINNSTGAGFSFYQRLIDIFS